MKNTRDKTLNVLVVDDDPENLDAAKQYFHTRKDVRVNYSTNYHHAKQMLESKVYAFALFDYQLPYEAGMEPSEEYGLHLASRATLQALPWALITSGLGHHHKTSAFVRYAWTGTPEFHEIMDTPKDSTDAWKEVYETLEKNTPNIHEIVTAKKRYLKHVHKMYVDKKVIE